MSDAGPTVFEPVNMVEQQLVAAASGDAGQQRAFERFILDETLYVATPEVQPEGTVTLKENTTVQLMNVPLNDGRQAMAVFTSPQRVAETFGDVGYMGIQGRILFEMIRGGPALLNPGQAYGVVWEPESMDAMLGLAVQRTVQKDTQVLLGTPAQVPTDLIQRLKSALGALPQVEAAWLALAAWPETDEQGWYLDVRSSSPDHDPIRRVLPGALDGADMHGRPLDMIINPVGKADGAGIAIITRGDAPQPKKKGLLGRLFG